MATIDEKLIKFETKNPVLDLKKKLKNPEEFWFSDEVLKFVNTLFKFEYDYFKYIEMDSAQFEELKKIVKDDIWEDKKYYKVLEYFFWENAPYYKKAWESFPEKMYQKWRYRRSFRAPNLKDYCLVRQINFLGEEICSRPSYRWGWKNDKYYDLSLEDEIRYSSDLRIPEYKYIIWAEMIDSGDEKIFNLMENIIFWKDKEGKISRDIIRSLLSSKQEKSWELVKKLLLSAQRQEWLRQTVLEALDETSFWALKYFIKVILDEKLTRFSSVVRAVDTWTGLWFEAEKETTIKKILTYADTFLNSPEKIEKAIDSKDNTEVYMALWSIWVEDIEKTIPYLQKLLEKWSLEKKCLALKFIWEISMPEIELDFYYKALDEENLQLYAFFLPRFRDILQYEKLDLDLIQNKIAWKENMVWKYPDLFEKLFALSEKIWEKEKNFSWKVFSWSNKKFEYDDILFCLIAVIWKDKQKLEKVLQNFEKYWIQVRDSLARNIFWKYYTYYYWGNSDWDKQKVTEFQKDFALRVLKDRWESIVASSLEVLENSKLTSKEIENFTELFKRKWANLRSGMIKIILKQEDDCIKKFTKNLLENWTADQKVAWLDILLQLKTAKKQEKFISEMVEKYSKKEKITDREKNLLAQLDLSKAPNILTEENWFGIYDPSKLEKNFKLPEISKNSIFLKSREKNAFGFSKTLPEIKKDLENLKKIFLENKNYEYEYEDRNGKLETTILWNDFRNIKKWDFHWIEAFENTPLYEVWDKWYIDSKLTPLDLFLLNFRIDYDYYYDKIDKVFEKYLEKYFYNSKEIFPKFPGTYDRNNPVYNIISSLTEKYNFKQKYDFMLDATISLFSEFWDDVFYHYKHDWKTDSYLNRYLWAIDYENFDKEKLEKLWNVHKWREYMWKKEKVEYYKPPLLLYCLVYKNWIIDKNELLYWILTPGNIRDITSKNTWHRLNENMVWKQYNLEENFPFLEEIISEIREKFLEVEKKRWDSDTTVSDFVFEFQRIYWAKNFLEFLKNLWKAWFHKWYIRSYRGNVSRKELFSSMIKRSIPLPTDNQESFNKLVKSLKIPENTLIDAAVYAPKWQSFISEYLWWKGLDSAIWWMHAHTKTSSYVEENSELESEVAKYSSIDIQDFKDWAVDKDWFLQAYKELWKAHFEMVYESAKYVSEWNGHRRARLYADVILWDLKIREVTAKVKEKRDQDYLRVYWLVPLSKATPEKDLLSRYEYLQQFKKESKEFGSMKQASEALALRIAMENLARNAGYKDPIRLTWAMEIEQVQKILSNSLSVKLDDTTVSLVIDDDWKADFEISKDWKILKAIPAKLKKDPKILELTWYRKTLREQLSRSRKSLEEAMVSWDEFYLEEIEKLSTHPVISKHLEKLVFVTTDWKIWFYTNWKLKDANWKLQNISKDSMLRIAHCVDLHDKKVWWDYQKYCFENELRQPFKQVFRELYVPTPDELKAKTVSDRYDWHQVQPSKTLALLKGKWWKIDYEEGLKKVFHKEWFQAELYAMADWFSPADIEAPTLSSIKFQHLKTYEPIDFKEINPRLFSEVMRDVDLVVSVAHVWGVDPETSHSTIEMRAVILSETLKLFKIKNVEIKQNNAIIKWELWEYSLHLWSWVVHQVLKWYISILPVHSQHRWKIFLPFVDDDPKTAEIISKALLLAKDSEIQDPTILEQIKR